MAAQVYVTVGLMTHIVLTSFSATTHMWRVQGFYPNSTQTSLHIMYVAETLPKSFRFFGIETEHPESKELFAAGIELASRWDTVGTCGENSNHKTYQLNC